MKEKNTEVKSLREMYKEKKNNCRQKKSKKTDKFI